MNADDVRANGDAARTPAFVDLRSPGCSLLLEVLAVDATGTSPLPRVVHWGAALDKDVDAAALVLASSPPVPHAALDAPIRRQLLPDAG
jgi:hypothetical protein